MMRSMFSAISGLKNHQIMLDVTANDIANVNTMGYKASRVTFQDSLAQLQRGGSGAGANTGGTNSAQVGLGVKLGSIDSQMQGGTVQSTGNALDVAIQGEGWFRVGQGNPPAVPTVFQYTRAGNFTRNDQGNLTTDGAYVIGRTAPGGGGQDTFINIPNGGSDVSVALDGSVSYSPANGGPRQIAGYLSLAKFPNEAGLERVAGNRWQSTANSGGPQVSTPGAGFGSTIGGTIEMSNVDLAAEFTNMIIAQRGFQANSRVISAADEMLQDLVNLKR